MIVVCGAVEGERLGHVVTAREDSPAVRRLFIFNRIDLGLRMALNRSRYLFLLSLDVSPPARLAFTKWRMSANVLW